MEILDIALVLLVLMIAYSLLNEDSGGGGKRSRQVGFAGAGA